MERSTAWAGCIWMALAIPLAGCSTPPTAPRIQTNEQGCMRQHNDGPQDPFKSPPPLREACVGPYALRVPANYFDNQMGPEFDGSFGLHLEYPQLQPFAPGERVNLKLDVSLRTVSIDYRYLDRVGLEERMRLEYEPSSSRKGPAERLEERIEGDPVYGLTPYYADLPRIYAFWRAEGLKDGNNLLEPSGQKDWYIARDAKGDVSTIIKCTSREVVGDGVQYRNGTLVAHSDEPYSECRHTFTIPALKIMVHVDYVRFALPDWKKIEEHARNALQEFMVDDKPPVADAAR